LKRSTEVSCAPCCLCMMFAVAFLNVLLTSRTISFSDAAVVVAQQCSLLRAFGIATGIPAVLAERQPLAGCLCCCGLLFFCCSDAFLAAHSSCRTHATFSGPRMQCCDSPDPRQSRSLSMPLARLHSDSLSREAPERKKAVRLRVCGWVCVCVHD
jgi:hypothetical protein